HGLGWSLKRLHYLMVTSSTYRQASDAQPSHSIPSSRSWRSWRFKSGSQGPTPQSIDPGNSLLWRMNRERLEAEAVRDSVLSAAGDLNLEMGGASIRVPLEPEVYATIFTEGEPDNLWPVHPDPRQHTRRSLYLLRKRNVRLPMLAVFDQPDMMTSCGARGKSVHALQALTLLNSDFMTSHTPLLPHPLLSQHSTATRPID